MSEATSTRASWRDLAVPALALAALLAAGYLVFRVFAGTLRHDPGAVGLAVFALVAGVATFFSPCSFPLLPAFVAKVRELQEGGASPGASPGGLAGSAALGALAFAALLGLIAWLAGLSRLGGLRISSGDPSPVSRALRGGLGALMLLLGFVHLGGRMPRVPGAARLAEVGRDRGVAGRPRLGLLLYGLGYALAGIGCAGPIAAGLLAFALAVATPTTAAAAFALYGLVLGGLMFAVTLAVARGGERAGRMGRHAGRIRTVAGALLLLAGVFTVASAVWVQAFRTAGFFPR